MLLLHFENRNRTIGFYYFNYSNYFNCFMFREMRNMDCRMFFYVK